MQIRCHSRAQGVAAEQQVARTAFASLARASVLGLVLGTSSVAGAAETSPAAAASAPSPSDGSYGVVLGASYVVGPLLALAVGGGLSEVEAPDALAVLAGGAVLVGAPMAVHLYRGAADRSALALGSMFGFTLGGIVGGGVVGYFENKIACDPQQESECSDRGIGTTIAGAAIGGVVGYVTSAVLDVAFRSSAPEAAASTPSAQLWAVPARAAGSPKTADGMLLGVTLRL